MEHINQHYLLKECTTFFLLLFGVFLCVCAVFRLALWIFDGDEIPSNGVVYFELHIVVGHYNIIQYIIRKCLCFVY